MLEDGYLTARHEPERPCKTIYNKYKPMVCKLARKLKMTGQPRQCFERFFEQDFLSIDFRYDWRIDNVMAAVSLKLQHLPFEPSFNVSLIDDQRFKKDDLNDLVARLVPLTYGPFREGPPLRRLALSI